jgi:rubrerythrin
MATAPNSYVLHCYRLRLVKFRVALGQMNYLMNTAHALQLAMDNEQRAHVFCDQINRESRTPEIAAMAVEFAAEEKEHLGLLQEWMERTESSVVEEFYDPDPPHMPEWSTSHRESIY